MGAFDILVAQHRELEECLTQFDGAPPHELGALSLELVALLRLHARLEERHLYPLLTQVGGRAQAQEEAEDHEAMRELTDELLELTPGSDEWLARLTALEDVVVAHIQWEEVLVLPRLAAALDGPEHEALRRAFLSTSDEADGPVPPHVPGGEPSLDASRWGV